MNTHDQPVALHGVDRSGPEYACSQGYGVFDGTGMSDDAEPPLIAAWGVNTEFIGLNEDCWLGINGVNPAYSGSNYRHAIEHAVRAIEAHHMYPVIGFFWGDPGSEVPQGSDPNGGGQPPLPDNDHAPLFWEEVADTFKSDPFVLFRLQEEPHNGATGTNGAGASKYGGSGSGFYQWMCWSQGSVQYSTTAARTAPQPPRPALRTHDCDEYSTNGSTLYQTVGMQSLINIIRGTGAANVIQVPGESYANMTACTTTSDPRTCGMLDATDGVKLTDPHKPANLMIGVDVYPDSNTCGSTTCYDDTYLPVALTMPLAADETGPGATTTKVDAFLNWLDTNANGYYAWAWDPWAGLISSYASPLPASPWGTTYRAWIDGTGPPSNRMAPSIRGTPREGQTVTATNGTWSPSGAAMTYQWQDCTAPTSGCSAILNARSQTYTPTASDVGHYLRVSVTDGNWRGIGTAVSAAVGPTLTAVQPTDGIKFVQQATRPCVNAPPGTISLSRPVTSGDDLFLVVGALSYTAPSMTPTRVSDNVNGAWTQLANSGSQQGETTGKYVAYAVYELQGSKAAPDGVTITIRHTTGGGMSAVAFEASGVGSASHSSFASTVGYASPFIGPSLPSVSAGDVVVGLFASYVTDGFAGFSAPRGWTTSPTYWTYSPYCGAAAFDWLQASSGTAVTPTINPTGPEYYFGGSIDLRPRR